MFLFNSVWPVYGVACATPVAEIIGCAVALVLVWRYMRTLKGSRGGLKVGVRIGRDIEA